MSSHKSSTVRVGVIGTSDFTDKNILQSLANHPNARITAICGRTRSRDEELAKKYSIPGIFTDYREMVRSADVDAVAVITPNDQHHPMTLAALEAGKHVLCEKPLALDLRQAQEMYDRARSAGLIHLVNYTHHGIPAVIHASELVRQGYVGDIYHIDISTIGFFNRGDAWTWRRDRAQAGTGALGDIGSHALEVARWMCGDVARVSAHLFTAAKELRLPDGKRVKNLTDDSCALLLEYKSGAQGVIHCSWSAHPGRGGANTRVEIHGSKGMLHWDFNRTANPASWLTLYGATGNERTHQIMVPGKYTDGLDTSSEDAFLTSITKKPFFTAQRLVESVLGRMKPEPGFEEGVRNQAVLDAAFQSHQTGKWVTIASA